MAAIHESSSLLDWADSFIQALDSALDKHHASLSSTDYIDQVNDIALVLKYWREDVREAQESGSVEAEGNVQRTLRELFGQAHWQLEAVVQMIEDYTRNATTSPKPIEALQVTVQCIDDLGDVITHRLPTLSPTPSDESRDALTEQPASPAWLDNVQHVRAQASPIDQRSLHNTQDASTSIHPRFGSLAGVIHPPAGAAVTSVARRPDIVVGIDVGQTCSGVAYSIGPDWSPPHNLNRWPGRHGVEKADKVATRISYSKARDEVQGWGFESTFGDEGVTVRENFLLTVDAEYEGDRSFTCHEARRWYCDYLTCLHREIERYFDNSIPRWRSMHVEYSFSTPTTWRNPAMIASIEKLIKLAGFADTAQQTVRMALTDAEAAATEASFMQCGKGDIFLICDAGGGTTNVNTMKVHSIDRWIGPTGIELHTLDHVEGVPIGSMLIDFRMLEHITERLQLIEDHLEGELVCLAEEMLRGKFQTVKHSFPNPVVDHFTLDVKGLAGSHTFPNAGITDSRMAIDRAVITEIFDQQLSQIFALIDDRLLTLEAEQPHEQVSYIIMSGGLGSSPYVIEEIKKRYQMNQGFTSRNTARIQTMWVSEPQLTVVRGLVRERTQQLGFKSSAVPGREVFRTRRCRNSYGVALRVLYDPIRHKELPFVTDPSTNQRWVENVVQRGEEINATAGLRIPYEITLSAADHNTQRDARIVMSGLPFAQLPSRTTDAGCQEVVSLKYRLTSTDMELVNQPFWKASFFFVVKLGSADIKFQIWGQDGILRSNHDSMDVDYLDPLETKSSSDLKKVSAQRTTVR
ncbi:hypothetical protein LTR56_003640 [Elasticomyces elasticus]|nr:hypothetical protein LTR56_003640 [Elasticomyces elasticus]KAK3663773.1 hypothetical protein LTR22_005474 [Elasticomyces elasticus]KAK4927292.1 hypothetical protein LTR49_005957 [Elasticomyces elasticus]KAK5767302.1 hypothetical protein LTS12_002455 [Elasticomyces elasticus]